MRRAFAVGAVGASSAKAVNAETDVKQISTISGFANRRCREVRGSWLPVQPARGWAT